jgi:hypothetical protein
MKILGCDPGIRGALALIKIDEFDLHVIDTIDIPTIGTKAKERQWNRTMPFETETIPSDQLHAAA